MFFYIIREWGDRTPDSGSEDRCVTTTPTPHCFNISIQGRQESNSRRGALETPALPLSYGPFDVDPISLVLY